MTTRRRGRAARPVRYPRIGACRDPLRLWFLEYQDARLGLCRLYYGNRDGARRALRIYRKTGTAPAEFVR